MLTWFGGHTQRLSGLASSTTRDVGIRTTILVRARQRPCLRAVSLAQSCTLLFAVSCSGPNVAQCLHPGPPPRDEAKDLLALSLSLPALKHFCLDTQPKKRGKKESLAWGTSPPAPGRMIFSFPDSPLCPAEKRVGGKENELCPQSAQRPSRLVLDLRTPFCPNGPFWCKAFSRARITPHLVHGKA